MDAMILIDGLNYVDYSKDELKTTWVGPKVYLKDFKENTGLG